MGEVMDEPRTKTPLLRGAKGFLRVMGNPFLVEVLGVNGKEVWVSFPGADYPLDGMGALLEFHSETGYVLFHTQVVRGPRRDGDGVVLERTETSENRQHRRHWRIPAEATVVLHPVNAEKHYTAVMENLSAGGVLVRTYAVLPLTCELEIQMPLDDGATHTIPGRIVYSEEAGAFESGPRNKYGVIFGAMPPSTHRALTWHLYKQMRKFYPQEVAALYPRSR